MHHAPVRRIAYATLILLWNYLRTAACSPIIPCRRAAGLIRAVLLNNLQEQIGLPVKIFTPNSGVPAFENHAIVKSAGIVIIRENCCVNVANE